MRQPTVVVTTKSSLRHQIFLSRACELFGDNIAGVFFQGAAPSAEGGKGSAFKKRLKEALPSGLKSTIRKLVSGGGGGGGYEDELVKLYCHCPFDYWRYFELNVFHRPDINDDESQRLLQDIAPDIIVVFGGDILKGAWLEPNLAAINLHTGVLPYYRSCNSNTYALYHEAFDKVGSSVHYIDAGVDTGATISRHLVDPAGFADFEKLKARIFADGIEGLVAAAVNMVESKERLPAINETAADSYYPHAAFTPYVAEVARTRLRICAEEARWPRFPSLEIRPKNPPIGPDGMVNGVYAFLYHGVSDPEKAEKWETAFGRLQTAKSDFDAHLKYLCSFAEPLKLSEVPGKLRLGPVDKPYFVISFDDAYKNLPDNAAGICERHGVSPAVFACADFADKSAVNYRVLLAMLEAEGESDALRSAFRRRRIIVPAGKSVLDFCKEHYQYRLMEDTVFNFWRESRGELPDFHLDWDGLRSLADKGWEIGNHTRSHCMLGKLDREGHEFEIAGNSAAFEKNGVPQIKWLSFPYGASRHVNRHTHQWMLDHPDWNGIFAKGGVNTFFSRTEWMRIGVGSTPLAEFKNRIKAIGG